MLTLSKSLRHFYPAMWSRPLFFCYTKEGCLEFLVQTLLHPKLIRKPRSDKKDVLTHVFTCCQRAYHLLIRYCVTLNSSCHFDSSSLSCTCYGCDSVRLSCVNTLLTLSISHLQQTTAATYLSFIVLSQVIKTQENKKVNNLEIIRDKNWYRFWGWV